jgi:GNAT superfamily N-acetyltransferase
MKSNLERMIDLAEEVFASRKDPDQLDVDEEVLQRLKTIHPATISEHIDGDGPVAWILLIPASFELMQRFLKKEISEKELFNSTPPHVKYDALYLCSALVLKEYRRKGIAKTLTLKAIASIQNDHLIKSLFVWAYTKEGEAAAEAIAYITSLPLYKR